MSRPPELLYHASSPTLYESNSSNQIITVRFPGPVRISSIRITPEGVGSPSGPGETYPDKWTGEVFLNVSPSDPVNALRSSKVEYGGGEWPVDYEIDMPERVSTRMITFSAPVSNITLSIYGYHAAGPSKADDLYLTSVSDRPVSAGGKEDLHWVSAWAGGIAGLVRLLGADVDEAVKQRSLACLDLIVDTQGLETIRKELSLDVDAINFILGSNIVSAFVKSLNWDADFLLDPAVTPCIPTRHPLHALLRGPPESRRAEAWSHLSKGSLPLRVLLQSNGDDLLDTPKGEHQSNMSRLVALAEDWARSMELEARSNLGLALDVLCRASDTGPLAYLASRLPRLTLIYNVLATDTDQRALSLPPSFALIVVASLLENSSKVIHGRQAYSFAATLAAPYIPHLPTDSPLRLAFTAPSTMPAYTPASSTPDTRRLSRLASATSLPPLSSASTPRTASGLLHTATPAELVSLLAPHLYAHLSTAPVPLLDIPSSLANTTPDSQANAWAGKVYTSHEFRNRDHDARAQGRGGVGPGAGGGGQAGGVGLGIKGALGVQGRVSRPASRHVDEYVR